MKIQNWSKEATERKAWKRIADQAEVTTLCNRRKLILFRNFL